jgi:preprotein translocase subunit SecB
MPKKKNIKPSRPADSNYEQFLRSVKPVGLALASSFSQVDREAYARLMKQKDGPTRSISTEYKLCEAEAGYFDATGKFLLTVTDGEKANPALIINCKYESHFHCKAPVDKDLAERFTASELRLVLWPYFRELVHDFCGKMGIPPVTIPFSTS